MEEKQVDLLFKVLKILDKEGVLKHIIRWTHFPGQKIALFKLQFSLFLLVAFVKIYLSVNDKIKGYHLEGLVIKQKGTT